MRPACMLIVWVALFVPFTAEAEEIITHPAHSTYPMYTVEVDEAKWSYSTEDEHFHIWLPNDVPAIKGVFTFVFHGCGQDLAENAEMRQLAAELDAAVVGFDKFYMFPGSEAPSSVLLNALSELGKLSDHPELDHAPIFTFGHSNATRFAAGFPSKEPERTIGWVAFKSAFGGQFSLPEIYDIPGMVLSGENDHDYFSDQLATVRSLRHNHQALMHILVEPGGGHGPSKPSSYTIVLAFMKCIFQLRVPDNVDPRQGPVELNEIKEQDGWLGQTLTGARVRPSFEQKWHWEQSEETRRKLEIAPYELYPGDKGLASWYPTEEYARKCQQFCMQANLPQWSKPLQPQEITAEDRYNQAKRLEQSDPLAAKNAYANLAETPLATQAAARLQDPAFIDKYKARVQLKRMWLAEMKLQNPPRFGKFAQDFHELNADSLTEMSDAAEILLTRYPNSPDATTARLMLKRYKVVDVEKTPTTQE